jgi:hypothetical protein
MHARKGLTCRVSASQSERLHLPPHTRGEPREHRSLSRCACNCLGTAPQSSLTEWVRWQVQYRRISVNVQFSQCNTGESQLGRRGARGLNG